MSLLLTVIAFIVIFSVLVLIHEWGHYIVAKKSGIKVEEFGFGLPPRIWGVRKGETIYSINAIPFGGFVRLLGEDNRDDKAARNPRSFSAKPARVRIMVILAGVFMNFLLAWVLLTVGFTFGIQPLILSSDDVFNSIQDGTIQVQPGIIVQDVRAGGAADKAGLKPGDQILKMNGEDVLSPDDFQNQISNTKNSTMIVEVYRVGVGDQELNLQAGDSGGLGFTPDQLMFLPRLVVQNVTPGLKFENGDVQAGDVLLQLDGKDIYTYDDYVTGLSQSKTPALMLLRGDQIVNTIVDLPVQQRVIISDVYPNTPAEKAGFQDGDVVGSVNGQNILLPQDVITLTKQNAGQTLTYDIERNGQPQTIQVQPDKTGLIGVGLSVLYPLQNQFMTFYNKDVATSVLKINDVHYPIWVAPIKAFDESCRLSGLTVGTFLNVIRSFFTQFTIPEGVAGPVGIAQMTYTFVQQGILSVLRFMALLSLSLGIINVLPIPALDGGRLFFILVELVTGRKINGKWESLIHAIGFALLMILILAVTYSDILKLF
jgi:regulator of sigma E protease